MQKKNITIIQHVDFEGPAYIAQWLEEQGLNWHSVKLYEGDALPPIEDTDVLIVMGGPMGVNDEEEHAWLKQEKVYIKECLRHKKQLLGICLGAQLIASVMGATVRKGRNKEIGWFPVRRTAESLESPLLAGIPEEITTFHWHSDTFGIPEGGKRIFKSESCENQGRCLSGRPLPPRSLPRKAAGHLRISALWP